MKTRAAFGKSLKELRRLKGVTQEDFSTVSSRTYISLLERGQKSPTLDKIEALAKVLKIHPASMVCLTYMHAGGQPDFEALARRVRADLEGVI